MSPNSRWPNHNSNYNTNHDSNYHPNYNSDHDTKRRRRVGDEPILQGGRHRRRTNNDNDIQSEGHWD